MSEIDRYRIGTWPGSGLAHVHADVYESRKKEERGREAERYFFVLLSLERRLKVRWGQEAVNENFYINLTGGVYS